MKLFKPFTAYMTTELMISAYTTERPVPTEYLSAEQNKHNLDIWEKTKVSFPVQNASEFDWWLINYASAISGVKIEVLPNDWYELIFISGPINIDSLADRLEVVNTQIFKNKFDSMPKIEQQIRLKPEAKEINIIIDANDPKFLLGILKSIEREMPKAKRKRLINLVIVRDYLLSHTSKGGKSSAYEMCEYLGIDPDLYTFNK